MSQRDGGYARATRAYERAGAAGPPEPTCRECGALCERDFEELCDFCASERAAVCDCGQDTCVECAFIAEARS